MTTYLLFGQRSGLEQKFSWFTHPRPQNFLTSPRVVWNNFKTTHIHHRICSSLFSRGYCQWKYLHQKWIRSCHFWFFVWRDNRPPPPNFSDWSCKPPNPPPPCFQQIQTNNLSCHSSPHQSLGIMSPCSPIKIHSWLWMVDTCIPPTHLPSM